MSVVNPRFGDLDADGIPKLSFRDFPKDLDGVSPWVSVITNNRYLTGLWRHFVRRLTLPGRWFFAFTIFLLFNTGATWPDVQVYVPFAFASGLWLCALAACILFKPNVAIRLTSPKAIPAGSTVSIVGTASSLRKILPGDVFIVPSRLTKRMTLITDNECIISPFYPLKDSPIRMELRCSRRGIYVIGRWRIFTSFPFNLVQSFRIVSFPVTIVVTPRYPRLTGFDILPGSIVGDSPQSRSIVEAYDFAGTREYRLGDDVGDMDWRATARLNTPIIRQYRDDYFQKIGIIFDTLEPRIRYAGPSASFEAAVSLVASIADFALRRGYAIEFVTVGNRTIMFGSANSDMVMEQLLELLAEVMPINADGSQPVEVDCGANWESVSNVVLLTRDWNERTIAWSNALEVSGSTISVYVVSDTETTMPCVGFGGNVNVTQLPSSLVSESSIDL